MSYTDYYPHGGALPGRNYIAANAYRFAYQGQEKDVETGLLNFELRMLDTRLGRWFAPDPYGQYYSPYVAMGNNPGNMIDPDGGYSNWSGDDFFATDRFMESFRPDWTTNADRMQYHFDQKASFHIDMSNRLDAIRLENDEKFGSGENSYLRDANGNLIYTSYGALFSNVKFQPTDISGNILFGDRLTNYFNSDLAGAESKKNSETSETWGHVGDAAFFTEQGLKGVSRAATSSASYTPKYAYRGMASAEATAAKALGNIAKTTKVIGRTVGVVGVVATALEFGYSDKSGADYARLTGAALIVGANFIPFAGPFISIGLGALDSVGFFDDVYNLFD